MATYGTGISPDLIPAAKFSNICTEQMEKENNISSLIRIYKWLRISDVNFEGMGTKPLLRFRPPLSNLKTLHLKSF